MKKRNLLKMGLALCLCLLMGGNSYAQDLKTILSGVANAVAGKTGLSTPVSIVGTWKYTGPDCKFDSDNLLAEAGGEVAAKKVESKMSSVMKKLGFQEGAVFVFNADSTYTSTVNGRTTKGTYSYDGSTKEIQMKTLLGVKFNATVSQDILSPKKMSLLFKADKVMSLMKTVGGALGKSTTNSVVGTANSLLKQYDGLNLGFALEKQ